MKIELDEYGTLSWFDDNGRLHREDGPAVVRKSGSMWWYLNGKLHRDGDKPAEFYDNGTKKWWVNMMLHRSGDKFAVVDVENNAIVLLEWYVNDESHNFTRPAVIFLDGKVWWYVNGKELTR